MDKIINYILVFVSVVLLYFVFDTSEDIKSINDLKLEQNIKIQNTNKKYEEIVKNIDTNNSINKITKTDKVSSHNTNTISYTDDTNEIKTNTNYISSKNTTTNLSTNNSIVKQNIKKDEVINQIKQSIKKDDKKIDINSYYDGVYLINNDIINDDNTNKEDSTQNNISNSFPPMPPAGMMNIY